MARTSMSRFRSAHTLSALVTPMRPQAQTRLTSPASSTELAPPPRMHHRHMSAPPHPHTRARGHVPPSLPRSFPVQPPLGSHPPRTHPLLLPDTPRPIGCALIPPSSCVHHFSYAESSDTAHTRPRPIPFSSSPMQQCPQNAQPQTRQTHQTTSAARRALLHHPSPPPLPIRPSPPESSSPEKLPSKKGNTPQMG
ncbi:hypothetical protein B0H14DRAFT_3492057 [Mycena olivaceomarginata]|nr:hypothetical protein B0H14DRAFT_3492057 [Mycena olivaceomarginata]